MEFETLTVKIDGENIQAGRGMTVLQAATAAGIYIPHLCHDPQLLPMGGCRLCLVEIVGMRGLPASCTTEVKEGMEIKTRSPLLDETLRNTMQLILSDHPLNCLTCVKNLCCELQRIAGYLGLQTRRLPPASPSRGIDTSNPVFDIDRDYCVLCQRCTRTCHELVGADIIAVIERGLHSRIGMFMKPEEMEPVCSACRLCVGHCPVAALSFKPGFEHADEVGERG